MSILVLAAAFLTFTTLYGDIVTGTFDQTTSSPLANIEMEFAVAFAQYNEIRTECLAGRVPPELAVDGLLSQFDVDISTLLETTDWADLTYYAETV